MKCKKCGYEEVFSGIVDYHGEPRFAKQSYTGNPHHDEWVISNKDGVPAIAEMMPKGWQPSRTMRVNGILGK